MKKVAGVCAYFNVKEEGESIDSVIKRSEKGRF